RAAQATARGGRGVPLPDAAKPVEGGDRRRPVRVPQRPVLREPGRVGAGAGRGAQGPRLPWLRGGRGGARTSVGGDTAEVTGYLKLLPNISSNRHERTTSLV